MLHHNQIVMSPQGWRTLTIDQHHQAGQTRYVGAIDGRPCLTALTREAAASALLRRALQSRRD
jgi:hypothetical protein